MTTVVNSVCSYASGVPECGELVYDYNSYIKCIDRQSILYGEQYRKRYRDAGEGRS